MAALSNYFFDTTQGYTQLNACVATKIPKVPTKGTFDTAVNADFKGNFDLKKLENTITQLGRPAGKRP